MQHHSDRTHQSGLTGKGGAWGKWKMFYGERSVFLWLDLREDTPEASVLQACLKERKEKKKNNSDATSPLQKNTQAFVMERDC